MTANLPAGTVSFLFTDIEDSTGLAQRLGIDFAPLIAMHFVLIRRAIAAAGGLEVKTTGDGVFAVFTGASSSIMAAVAIQQAFAGHRWPTGGDVRVRIGIHTGEAVEVDDDYVGIDVHRASRVMAAAHGGQVVVTEATHLLADDSFSFRELGRHLLRGLEVDEFMYQVIVPGLPSEFPPLRTARAITTNLPTRLSPIIGRETEVEALSAMLEENRLVSLLGPGGVGKTSLALTVGSRLIDRFSGGVVFVDLSSVSDPDFVIPSVAKQLGVEPTTIDAVVKMLADEVLLLIIDNFEQVEPAAPQIGGLLAATTGTRALVTSQVPLRIAGEARYLLDPLDPDGSVGVSLFLDRAKAIAPGFVCDENEVRELVAYLGGLPLAIELVAARANILGPVQMLERLRTDRMSYGTQTDAPQRHRTLDDAIGWSYDLLGDSTRRAFRRLGVFAGSMSIDSAEVVIGDDAFEELAELVDRSLLRRVVETGGRFTMLDGLRRYARRRLAESPESDEITERYVRFFVDLAGEAHDGLLGDRGEWWRAQLNGELENLREVLAILQRDGRRGDGMAMLGDVWRFYQSSGHMVEFKIWLDRFFELAGLGHDVGTIKGLMARSAVLYWQKRPDEAITGYREAVDLARSAGDESLLAEALYGLATSLIVAQQTEEAGEPLAEAKSIYSRLGDQAGLADVLAAEAFASLNRGGWGEAGPMFKEAGEMYTKVGRHTHAAQTLLAQAGAALVEGRLADARASAVTAIRRGIELSDVFLQVWGVEYVSRVELDMGNHEFAALLAAAAAAASESMGGGWSPATIGLEDTTVKMVRELGEAEAARLLEPGRNIGVEEAVALALGETE